MRLRPTRRELAFFFSSACRLAGQESKPYYCPMDPDIRSATPGKCPRCGMALRSGWAPPERFELTLAATPNPPRPGQEFELKIGVRREPAGTPVLRFVPVHERLLHLFIVSRDLESFEHAHPELQPDGSFRLRTVLKRAGMYRLLADFAPSDSDPQLIPETLIVPGQPMAEPELHSDLAPKTLRNLTVALRTEPAKPIAGQKTLLFCDLDPIDGVELYLGAWGHLLAASADLIDLIHEHPFLPKPASTVQFNLIFPRPGAYRLWAQFQRRGEVNTAVFTVLVQELS